MSNINKFQDFKTDTLINKLQKVLQSEGYDLVVTDIPGPFINSSRNRTKSTKSIDIQKDGDTYIDFYYNEFTLDKIKKEAEFWLNHKDRDMDPITAAHFKTIANILNNF